MTGISTRQTTFWPRDSRYRPVEEVSDPCGRKLELATPNEAGKLVREDEKPLPITAWGDVTLLKEEGYYDDFARQISTYRGKIGYLEGRDS